MSTTTAAEILAAMWAMHGKADSDGVFSWPAEPVATILDRGRHKGWISGPSKPPSITPSGWAALKPVMERLEGARPRREESHGGPAATRA